MYHSPVLDRSEIVQGQVHGRPCTIPLYLTEVNSTGSGAWQALYHSPVLDRSEIVQSQVHGKALYHSPVPLRKKINKKTNSPIALILFLC